MTMYGDFAIPAALASAEDYVNYAKADAPSNIDRILQECSSIVLDATMGAIYTVDTATGIATDTQVANALRDMTCAQALAWVKLKIDPDLAGVMVSTAKTSKKIGTAAFTYAEADANSAASARSSAQVDLVPTAVRIGRLNNLLGNEPFAL